MFPPKRIGKPPKIKRKMPRIVPRPGQQIPMAQPIVQPAGQIMTGGYMPPDNEMNEMNEPPGPEEPEMPTGISKLKNMGMTMRRRQKRR